MTPDLDLSKMPTTDLLIIFVAILSGGDVLQDYDDATPDDRLAFYTRLRAEIDCRIPTR